MFGFIAISLGILVLMALTFYVVRRIVKLPSRYERRPKDLTPWNALDQGIDPSISEKPNS
jgi:hypothetical protein